MRRTIRWACAWLAALWLLVPAGAGAQGLELAEALKGEQSYPEGAAQPSCVLQYELPQFAVQGEADLQINAYYQSLCETLSASLRDQSTEAEESDGFTNVTAVGYQITANTDSYLSVILTQQELSGHSQSERMQANVFARDGVYAGQPVLLSQMMGLESVAGEGAEPQTYASQLVYRLVWQIIEQQQASKQKDYLEGLAPNDLEAAFLPETDFYMDMDGNLVFYVQPGLIAGEVEGVLTYPFALAELLAAVRE